jgi:hypothetical protein
MNIFSFKLRIDSIQVTHQADGSIQVSGWSSFQFNDGQQTQVRSLAFTAYGINAKTIAKTGINGVVVAVGEVNIFSVDRQTRKDKVANFNILEVEFVRQGNPVQGTLATPAQPPVPAQPRVANAPAASPENRQPVGVATVQSNGHSPVNNDDEISF